MTPRYFFHSMGLYGRGTVLPYRSTTHTAALNLAVRYLQEIDLNKLDFRAKISGHFSEDSRAKKASSLTRSGHYLTGSIELSLPINFDELFVQLVRPTTS